MLIALSSTLGLIPVVLHYFKEALSLAPIQKGRKHALCLLSHGEDDNAFMAIYQISMTKYFVPEFVPLMNIQLKYKEKIGIFHLSLSCKYFFNK